MVVSTRPRLVGRLHSCYTPPPPRFCASVAVADRTLILLCHRRRVIVSRALPFLPPSSASSASAPPFLPHSLASVSATLCNSAAPPRRHPSILAASATRGYSNSLSLQLRRLCILNLVVLHCFCLLKLRMSENVGSGTSSSIGSVPCPPVSRRKNASGNRT
ncbi:hypothetical protein PIB30_035140 [Stylosanthes scabra]|uniref:Uncharacterized protein n=1 Tax=Stylosanthes scabra TaxID=79078 RepID=A0ABU6UEC4_9FABA|nr:hypothetical protein [Stylosanthes scabra]